MFYLDHASATPLSKKAQKAMEPYLSDDFFNPSAPYLPAQKIRDDYDSAKDQIANAIGARGNDIIITASATEATNLAFTLLSEHSTWKSPNRVLISAIEHPSVTEVAKNYGNYGVIGVNTHGLIDLAYLESQITPDTELVSIALASSDLGTIQPIAKVAEIIASERDRRRQNGNTTPIYLHSDASAALLLLDTKVSRLGIDLLTLSSSKIYGPKGVAALWAHPKVALKPLILGGGQESTLRSGTENVPGVIGFATALEDATARSDSAKKRLLAIKSTLKQILSTDENIVFLGDEKHQLASHLPISIPGLDAERLIYALEKRKVYVSTGAACSADKHETSPTLEAIGLSPAEIAGSLRISLGKLNTLESIKKAGQIILDVIKTERNQICTSGENLTQDETKRGECVSSPNKKVFLGLSGGVDSSLSAYLLKEQGYDVTCVYMKNWSKDLPGHKCPWSRDLSDAKRTATYLGLPFQIFDLEKDYKQKVVDYMLAEYQKGNTPNPDIMCNSEIKFKVFADLAFTAGADYIATGHYAQTDGEHLFRATDDNKDQTYFLYRTDPKIMAKTLFPIGHLEKPAVKKFAESYALPTAQKKESMGICFVGKVGIREFLSAYYPFKIGDIRDIDTDQVLGQHDGAIFYTLGQRHGLDIGGGLPYYIVKKDMENNIIYVSRDLNSADLWTDKIQLRDLFLRQEPMPKNILVRLRHRAPLVSATLTGTTLAFKEKIKRPAPGQSAVFYDDKICLGGGIII